MILSSASNGIASRYWFYLHLEQHWFYIFINETVGEIFLTSTCIKLSSAHKNSQFKKKKKKEKSILGYLESIILLILSFFNSPASSMSASALSMLYPSELCK